MEQERKIEKWLKAYAKKRRGQASDPFKLDPATRRILQNEVSRSAEQAEDDDDTVSLWELLRKNWIYLLGFAACVFVLATFFFAGLNKATLGPQSASLHKLGEVTDSLELPVKGGTQDMSQLAARNRRLSENEAVGPVTRESARIPSQNFAGAITITNANLAVLTPPATFSDRSVAKAEKAPPSQAASDEVAAAPAGLPAAPPVNIPAPPPETAPPAPAAPTVVGGNYAVNSTPANSDQTWAPRVETFRNGTGGALQGSASQKDYLKTAASRSQSAVLVNFQLLQNGNTIRVVDQDGSVYVGSLEAEGYKNGVNSGAVSFWSAPAKQNNRAAQNANSSKAESPKMTQLDKLGDNSSAGKNAGSSPEAVSSGLSPATAKLPPGAEPQSSVQKFSFYAEGTNRTLNENVVFAGTLLEDLSMAGETQQTFGMTANAAVGAGYAQQFMRSVMTNQPLRIEGIAIIDQTNKIQINATSVPAKSESPHK